MPESIRAMAGKIQLERDMHPLLFGAREGKSACCDTELFIKGFWQRFDCLNHCLWICWKRDHNHMRSLQVSLAINFSSWWAVFLFSGQDCWYVGDLGWSTSTAYGSNVVKFWASSLSLSVPHSLCLLKCFSQFWYNSKVVGWPILVAGRSIEWLR